jgi:hypothetical protein
LLLWCHGEQFLFTELGWVKFLDCAEERVELSLEVILEEVPVE